MDDRTNVALRYRSFGDPRSVLALEAFDLPSRPAGAMRVRMIRAAINPSDIIPVTGAYRHLITPPKTAGYEGVGTVVEAPAGHAHLEGRRVLPLRGDGTWQRYVDCDPRIAVPVPDDIPDHLAARAYINPLTARVMSRRWPVAGKHIVLTGAGSGFATLMAQWAREDGAASITGIHRSPTQRAWLDALGVSPIVEMDTVAVENAARRADITFDAVGGPVGSRIINAMRPGTEFVGYGLLSGQPVLPGRDATAAHRRFHLRDALSTLDTDAWHDAFQVIWRDLPRMKLQDPVDFPMARWRDALDAFDEPGRSRKPMLLF